MNAETVAQLNAVNRRFYDERADEFNQTRERAWRGWDELFERYGSNVPSSPTVLDVGCGNGRFARFLHQHLGQPFTYVGIDASALGLEHARKRLDECNDVHLHEHDFIAEADPTPPSLEHDAFGLIVAFGVLHHIPGSHRRRQLLTSLARHLSPGGVLAYTVWRFDRFERFTRKLVPRDELLARVPALDLTELEPGDHLMTWGATEPAVRYCHAMSDAEAAQLESALPLTALPSFLGDQELNRYHILTKP